MESGSGSSKLADFFQLATPLSSGFNTDVFKSKDVVFKLIGAERLKEGSKKIDLHYSQVRYLGQAIEQYHRDLKAAGVCIPPEFVWLIGPTPIEGVAYLVVVQSFVGFETAKYLLLNVAEEAEIRTITQRILAVMEPIFKPNVMGNLGLDPLPENFILRLNNDYYVDLFPPRCKVEGQAIVEYPEPVTKAGYELGYWKHYTAEGLIVVLLTQLARIRPHHFNIFWEEITKWLKEQEHSQILDKLNSYLLIGGNKKGEAIASTENPYQLRLVACQLASNRIIEDTTLKRLFRMTHYEDGDLKPIMDEAKKLLLGS